MVKIRCVLLFIASLPTMVWAQMSPFVRLNPQHHFSHYVPKGNYSGLTWLGADRYALVSDKAPQSGFFVFRIQTDSVSGDIIDVRSEGFRSSDDTNHDEEDIVFFSKDSTLFVSREGDNRIVECRMDGRLTGRELSVPRVFEGTTRQYGFEGLTYNAETRLFWTISESTLKGDGMQADYNNRIANRLRLQSFDEAFMSQQQYAYLMDAPQQHASASVYAMGVPALAALDDGRLLVLEREFLVTSCKLGSFVVNKLFCVNPLVEKPVSADAPLTAESAYMQKSLLVEWKTSLTFFRQNLANYEGMCLGPRLVDGSQVIVLCADSQNQYGGVLRDWFRTVVIR
ncbi:MAG: esterase-like activity of phytase family protein [Prevotella sp.]|nr:esterase-like activity of phytase family protein [Prevotella sp.]